MFVVVWFWGLLGSDSEGSCPQMSVQFVHYIVLDLLKLIQTC